MESGYLDSVFSSGQTAEPVRQKGRADLNTDHLFVDQETAGSSPAPSIASLNPPNSPFHITTGRSLPTGYFLQSLRGLFCDNYFPVREQLYQTRRVA